ncbi:hypothetical protein [Neisseria bergeri]|uniref:hypothetical protein n=1 Tax=Neisseria bergeri TaxID=1906581 RepID=UPI00272DC127|nr:hypothetical protein [Neisseria bergeri]
MPSEQNLSISDGIGISKKASRQLRRRMKHTLPLQTRQHPRYLIRRYACLWALPLYTR